MDYDELIRIANHHFTSDKYLPAYNYYLKAAKIKPSEDLINKIEFIFNRITEAHLDHVPRSAKDYRYRAIAYAYNENYEAAIMDCRIARDLDPKEAKNYVLEAECHKNLGAYQEAIDLLISAINIDGKGDYYYKLSLIAAELGNYESAEHCIRYAIDDDRNKAEYRLHFGKILMAGKRYKDAFRELYYALELDKNLSDIIIPLGVECEEHLEQN